MNIDHQKLSNTYELIYESSSDHSLYHTIELLLNYDFEMDAIDFDLILDNQRITNIVIDSPSTAINELEKGIDLYLGEKIGVLLTHNIKQPLFENVGYMLADVEKTSDNITSKQVSKVIVKGNYTVTKAPVRI